MINYVLTTTTTDSECYEKEAGWETLFFTAKSPV
jgi:hypothetical protein